MMMKLETFYSRSSLTASMKMEDTLRNEMVGNNCCPPNGIHNPFYYGLAHNELYWPIEVVIAAMEQKHKFGKQDEPNMVLDVLNTIRDCEIDDLGQGSSLWVQNNFDTLKGLKWEDLKRELRTKFGKNSKYDDKDKTIFIQSIRRGSKEPLEIFLFRITTIVSFIEFGELSDGQSPSDIWVNLLLLIGLDQESKKYLPTDINGVSSDSICKHIARKCPKLFFEISMSQNDLNDLVDSRTATSNMESPYHHEKLQSI